ncbi:MAG: hypothetical protein LBV18_02045, partial [Alistipes sp.]|nr:hypothetical protein [Alistipes sp.]
MSFREVTFASAAERSREEGGVSAEGREPVMELTADGSPTLRSPFVAGADGAGETYHSTRGAVGEARHVYIEA